MSHWERMSAIHVLWRYLCITALCCHLRIWCGMLTCPKYEESLQYLEYGMKVDLRKDKNERRGNNSKELEWSKEVGKTKPVVMRQWQAWTKGWNHTLRSRGSQGLWTSPRGLMKIQIYGPCLQRTYSNSNRYNPWLTLWEIVPGKMGPCIEGFVRKSNVKSVPERLVWWSGMSEANMKTTN